MTFSLSIDAVALHLEEWYFKYKESFTYIFGEKQII